LAFEYTVFWNKETKIFFCDIFYKTRVIFMIFGTWCLELLCCKIM